jgi:nitroreductase
MGPNEAELSGMLEAAQRAPDHRRLKPWRFVIVEGEARQKFGELLAASLRRREPAASEQTLEVERMKAFRAPVIVVVAAEVQHHPKIPEIEQVLAAAAAAQNILLAAHSLGLGATWKTGGAAYDESVKTAFGLARRPRSWALFVSDRSPFQAVSRRRNRRMSSSIGARDCQGLIY